MREYKQLTEEDRIEIYAMKQAGKQQNQMATAILYAAHATFFGDLVVVLILDSIQEQTRRRKSEIKRFITF